MSGLEASLFLTTTTNLDDLYTLFSEKEVGEC